MLIFFKYFTFFHICHNLTVTISLSALKRVFHSPFQKMFHVEHFLFFSCYLFYLEVGCAIIITVIYKIILNMQEKGEKMGKIIAIVNQKGGVGKTTTTINLAAGIGKSGKRCLLIDIDPQGNSTSGLGISKRQIEHSSYDVIIGETDAADAIIKTKYKNVNILPSSMDLAGAEVELVEVKEREQCLKKAVAIQRMNYDYILLDCPPSLGMLTINALVAADTVLVPIQCEYYALEGLSQLMNSVRQIKRLYNSQIDIEGVLLTMYDGRLNLTQQVVREIKRFFPKKVFKTVIPRSVRLSEAPSYGEPIQYYDKNSKGAIAYDELAAEIIKNNKKRGD